MNCHNCFKTSDKCDLIGTIDGLISFLGIVRYKTKERIFIESIQKDLFKLNDTIAFDRKEYKELIDINKACNKLESIIKIPKTFVIPGRINEQAAYIDYARTLVRDCERKLIKYYNKPNKNIKYVLNWINRLSYYLWLLARLEEQC